MLRGLGGNTAGPPPFLLLGQPNGYKLAYKLDGSVAMDEVGLFEAKNKFSELVDRAERGEEIVITRRGRAVAKLVPAQPVRDKEKARRAVEGIRELAKQMNLGPFDWEEWKRYRDEGRE